MKKTLIILVCALVPLAARAQSYTSTDLQSDFAKAYELTGSIYRHAVQTGDVMTRTFAPRGRAVYRHSSQQLQAVEQSIRPELNIRAQTRMLQATNQRMFLELARPTPEAESLRSELAGLLEQQRYRTYRWGLVGVVDLLGARKDVRETPSVKRLKSLSPALRRESEAAVKEIHFGFLQMPVESSSARESLIKHYQEEAHRPGTDAVRGSSITEAELQQLLQKRRTTRGGPGGSDSGFDWDDMQQLGSDIMNSVADNLYDDFQQGTEYGSTAGQIIGTVSGMHDAVNTVAQGATAADLVDAAVGEALPDPYEIVGHYAGGVIGMIGGALGTTAGWIVGTIEAEMAQNRSAPVTRTDTTGGTEGTFADFER